MRLQCGVFEPFVNANDGGQSAIRKQRSDEWEKIARTEQ